MFNNKLFLLFPLMLLMTTMNSMQAMKSLAEIANDVLKLKAITSEDPLDAFMKENEKEQFLNYLKGPRRTSRGQIVPTNNGVKSLVDCALRTCVQGIELDDLVEAFNHNIELVKKLKIAASGRNLSDLHYDIRHADIDSALGALEYVKRKLDLLEDITCNSPYRDAWVLGDESLINAFKAKKLNDSWEEAFVSRATPHEELVSSSVHDFIKQFLASKDEDFETFMLSAGQNGQTIENAIASINKPVDQTGRTAIFYAHNEYDLKKLKALGASIDVQDKWGNTPFSYALQEGRSLTYLEQILAVYPEHTDFLINTYDIDSFSSLHHAILLDDEGKVSFLLAQGARCNEYKQAIKKGYDMPHHLRIPLFLAILSNKKNSLRSLCVFNGTKCGVYFALQLRSGRDNDPMCAYSKDKRKINEYNPHFRAGGDIMNKDLTIIE